MSNYSADYEIGARVTLVGADKAAADAKLVSEEVKGIGSAAEEADAKAAAAGSERGGLAALRRAGQGVNSVFAGIGRTVRSGVGSITGVGARAANGLSQAGAQAEALGRKAESAGFAGAGGFAAFGKSLSGVKSEGAGLLGTLSKIGGGVVLGAGIAAGAGLYESITLASKFNSEMSLIQTQAHASAGEIGGVRSAVLGLAGQTAQSPENLATALYHIESNGLRGKNALSALTLSAKAATVGHANLVDVTNALGAVIASKMVPGVNNYSAAVGILNATVGAGDMHMQDLAEAMGGGNLAAVSNFGVKIQDVGAALAVFGDNNLRGAAAGTQLRMAVQNLAAPIKSGVPVLNALGLSAGQLGADIRKGGLNSAIVDLHNHLEASGVTGKKVGAVLTQAFGRRAGTGIITLESQFERFQGKYKDVSKGAGQFGQDWKTTTEQTSFQFHRLVFATEAWAISVGEKAIPMLQKLGIDLEHAGVWLTKHKIILAAIGGVIGAILIPALIAFTVTAVTSAIGVMIAWAPFIIFFGAVGAAIYEVATHWSDVKQWAADAFNFVRDNVVRPFVDFFLGMAGTILGAAASAFGWIPGIGGKLKEAKKAFADFKQGVDASLGDTNAQLQQAVGNLTTFNQKTSAMGVPVIQIGAGASGTQLTFSAGGVKLNANGGFYDSPTLGILGEAGPEVVLPLNNPNRSQQLLRQAAPLSSGTTIPFVPDDVVGGMGGPSIARVYLDRKVIGEAVFQHARQTVART